MPTRTKSGKWCQQYELYAAEAEYRRPGVTPLDGIIGVRQWFVDHVRDTEWWGELVEPHVAYVEFASSRAEDSCAGWLPFLDASGGYGRVQITPKQCTVETVIHELAHVASDAINDSQSHDPFFACTQLELTYYVLGSDHYARLASAYADRGIEVANAGISWQRRGLIAL